MYYPEQFKQGYWYLWQESHRLEGIRKNVGHPTRDITYERAKVLSFWRKHGLAATRDAFGISRATLFRWKKQLRPKSRARHSQSRRVIPAAIEREILRLRTLHPHLGKEKIQKLLTSVCQTNGLPIPSISTVGRYLTDLKERKLLSHRTPTSYYARTDEFRRKHSLRQPKKRKKGYEIQEAGDLLELDTVVTFRNGLRRYTVTAVDVKSRFAFAWNYSSHSSRAAKDFFTKLQSVVPFSIKAVQTDNGSEFLDEFRTLLEKQEVTHFFNYPNRPQWNGHVERFNRTIQEEFLSWHTESLVEDLPTCNQKLMDYLLWYNGSRPHYALGQIPPMVFLFPAGQSQSGWTHTSD